MTSRIMERDTASKSGTKASAQTRPKYDAATGTSSAETAVGSTKPPAKKATKNSKAKPKVWERARGGSAKPVSELVPQIGRAAFRRFGFVQANVVSHWPDIVGTRHAEACRPEMIRFPMGQKDEGTLHLVVRAAHAPLIQHVVPEIIERVNRFFGYRAVAQVRLRQGNVQDVHGKAAPARRQPTETPIPLEMDESLRDITDPDLRKVLESLARSIDAKEKEQR